MAGDGDQWTLWLDQHGPALVLFARQWVSGQADAEDVVQEAFVRFWRARQRVAEPAGYLYACVKHAALDWQRRRKRQFRREEAVARPEADALFERPGESDERGAAVVAAMQILPEEQREVLVMKIWGNLSFPEISRALQIPANTAASRYRYALIRLREELVEESVP